MAGLVGYESSDDDDDDDGEVPVAPETKSVEFVQKDTVRQNGVSSISTELSPSAAPTAPTGTEKPSMIGPMPQPAEASNASFPPLEEAPAEDEAPAPPPGSPYSANRALLRDLTLPAVPNMDIPPSPPGSPPPVTNKKFEQFLELKKKGVHFNSKIAQSPALRNPSLMDKLMNFVEMDQMDQYRTTLPAELWDPGAFPRTAFKEQLRQSQVEIGQARARAKGGPVEFVAASKSGASSRDSTPGASHRHGEGSGSIPGKRKTRFDT